MIKFDLGTMRDHNWANEVPYGWQPEFIVDQLDSMNLYFEMIEWIYKNINAPEQNVHWTIANWPVLRFRKAKDQVWFFLRWS